MDQLTYKALRKYRKRCARTGEACRFPDDRSGPVDVLGRQYTILRDNDGIFAVYGSTSDGGLQHLLPQNWPAGID